ncbi:MAG: hypothetical protein OHK0022_32880 [Roseiflexaceae bacterium]
MTEPTTRGTVKWFNSEKGFGFIATAQHGELFVHVSQIPSGTILEPGTVVTCGVREGRRGLEATNVRVVGAPPRASGPAAARGGPAGRPARPAATTTPAPAKAAAPPGPSSVKITLIGRPKEVRPLAAPGQTPPPCYALVMDTNLDKQPPLPKGVPPINTATTYLVIVSGKQWRKVAQALADDADDRVVIEGYGGLDPLAPKMITIRATAVNSTALQRAKRAAATGGQEQSDAADEAQPGEPTEEGANS